MSNKAIKFNISITKDEKSGLYRYQGQEDGKGLKNEYASNPSGHLRLAIKVIDKLIESGLPIDSFNCEIIL